MMVLAFALRTHRLAGQSIWYDEGLSVYYARRPLPELLALVSGSDHPPLYFLLLHFWLRLAAFGQPAIEYLVRYPSVIFGVLLVPLVYVLGSQLLSRQAGLLAAVLIAISPFHVWYSQETRMYTLVAFLTLWASYALLSNLQDARRNTQHATPTYCLTMTLALYAHFYATLILLAHAVFVTWWAWHRGRWHAWARWAGASAVAVLLFLPWGGLAAGQLRANDTYWRGTLALGRTISQTAQAFAVGETITGRLAIAATLAYLLLGAATLLIKRRVVTTSVVPERTSDSLVFLLTYILVPLITLLAVSYNRPKFAPRYLLTATPALALLASQGVVTVGQRPVQRRMGVLRTGMALALLGVIVAANGLSLRRHYTEERQFKADWRAAAEYIGEHGMPGDAVVVVAGHAMPAFDFYNARQLDVYPIPSRLLPTVTDPVESGDVTTTLNQLVAEGHDRAWLILWQERLADPRRLTLNLLFEHGRRLGVNQHFHGLNVLLFELPAGVSFDLPQPPHQLDALFDQRLRLVGYDLSPISVLPGDTVTLRLYWRAVEPVSQDVTVFTQLLSDENRIVGQHDRRLGGDQYPAFRWSIDDPVRETYQLTVQPGTPPGHYRLIAGVYLPPTGPRLLVEGNSAAWDHVVMGEIEVRAAD